MKKKYPFFLVSFLLFSVLTGKGQSISTYVSGNGDNLSAVQYGRINTTTIAFDASQSNLYIGDENGRIRRYNIASGKLFTYAGTSVISYSGTSITGNAQYTSVPNSSICMDVSGNMYIASASSYNRVYKISNSGMVTTIAGTGGSGGFNGDGILATSATLNNAAGVAVDAAGNIYIVDKSNHRIRRIDPSGIISTIAGIGIGGNSGDGGSALSAKLNFPGSIAFDGAGNMYIADLGNETIRKVNTSGIITTIAGTGTGGFSGDGGTATSAMLRLESIAFSPAGELYLADRGNHRIRKINSSGIITTVAGNGTAAWSGDGGAATSAGLQDPIAITFDASGNLYIGDSRRVRKVSTGGIISTIVGNGVQFAGGFAGDGGDAKLALINTPSNIGVDRQGRLYMAMPFDHRIRMVDNATGIISTIAGNGSPGYSGDGGSAVSANLYGPNGAAADRQGNIYIADKTNARVRKISPSGIISTVAGGGSSGLGDGGPAVNAVITAYAVAVDSPGNLYILDQGNNRIRKVNSATGIITTVAGTGSWGFSGDGGAATAANLNSPSGIALDRAGNLYIADEGNGRVRKVSATGTINTIAGGGTFAPDGVPATSASIGANGVAVDKYGNILIPNYGGNIVYKVDVNGYIHPFAGNGVKGYMGDGLLPTQAELMNPGSVAVDTSGNVFIAEITSNVVRKVCCLDGNADNPPLFTHTDPVGLSMCASSPAVSLDTILKVTDVDGGDLLKWSVWSAPSHGTLSGFPYNTTSIGGVITPAGLSYTPTLGFSGYDNFVIKVTDGTDIALLQVNVTVNPLPTSSVYGPNSVCVSDSIQLLGYPSGGMWAASNTLALVTASGKVYGLTSGVDTISYTTVNTCGSAIATQVVTVNPLAVVGTITGSSLVCEGSSTSLYNTVAGGYWSSSSPYVFVTADGLVIGIATGSATVTYTRTNTCGAATTTTNITVLSAPSSGLISGPSSVCIGGADTLTASVAGGTWSSSVPTIATVGTSGVVTGVSVGASIISYTVSNSCGSNSAIAIMNVTNATPIAPITGASSVCTGTSTTLTNTSPVGTWSSSNAGVASVTSTGVVNGVSAGIAIISYVAHLGCGTSVATFNMVVNTTPTAGIITGPATLCSGSSAILSSYATGGTWAASNGLAIIGPTGIITGVNQGRDTITYTVTNACGTASATYTVNIYPAPNAGTLAGVTTVCAGSTTTFSSTAAGGTWVSGNNTIATVGSSSGIVVGVSHGTATISYIAATGCGTEVATRIGTVNTALAGTITGITNICAGGTSTLSSTVAGGVWSSSSSSVATISSSGVVTAISGGAAVISYAVTNGCGTDVATTVFNVGSLPVVSPITGAATVCAGNTTTLSEATLSGTWSSSNPTVATVNSAGIVSGLTAGTTSISYMVTAGCGATGVTNVMTVNTVPGTPTISGSNTVCEAGVTTLSGVPASGAWSSSNTAVAFVSAGGGAVTGVVAGTALITYTVSNICGIAYNTRTMNVNPLPNAGAVFGSSAVCMGTTITLSTTVAMGTWTSSDVSIATTGITDGVVSGISAGAVIISYHKSNSCGTAVATKAITVNPMPVADTITGPTDICQGAFANYSTTSSGGIWGTTAPAVANISSLGTALAINSGTTTIFYAVTNACGTATATKTATVSAPTAGTITGITTLCNGSTGTLTSSVSGGTWSSSTTAVAIIGTNGIVSTVSPGSTVITYTAAGNGCGTAISTVLLTVGTLPSVAEITGNEVFCAGSVTTLADATAGGAWSSSNAAVASVNAGGVVTGVAQGTAMISYAVSAGCGSSTVTKLFQVEGPLNAASLSGAASVCKGSAATLAASVAGGDWHSGNIAIATVDADGTITGISTGTAVISYTIANSCGAATAIYTMAVTTVPNAGYITGAANVCEGDAVMLTSNLSTGTWSTSNPINATISFQNASTATVNGLASGSATISYVVTNACGSNYATATLYVHAAPNVPPIAGNSAVEVSRTTTLINAMAGGIWTSSNPTVATISYEGIVSGLTMGSTTVSYTLTNLDGCSASSTVEINVRELNSGVHGTFELFPNPTSYQLTVAWSNQYAKYADIVITDMLGQFVYKGFLDMPTSKGQQVIPLEGIASGMYIVNIKYAGDFYDSKISIVK